MDDLLLWILSIIGLLALYWVLFGQWKFNRQWYGYDKLGNDETAKKIKDIKEQIKKAKEEKKRKKKVKS